MEREIRSAEAILQEVESTRQQIGSLTMLVDGAQVHFMMESLVEALKVCAELYVICKNTPADEWNNNIGSQADNLKTARELCLTGLSTIKTYVEALPDNLKDFDKNITPDKLDAIETLFKEGY
jgi:hypothetical protein